MSELDLIYGLQPVREAIRAGQPLQTIYLARAGGRATEAIKSAADGAGIEVVWVARSELDRRAEGANHQGVVALGGALAAGPSAELSLADLLARAENAGEAPLIVLLDEVQDPYNLGALIRSAHAFGAHGVVIPKHRSAAVTPTVVKASAGATAHLPVVTVTNLKRALETLAEAGVWSVATAADGPPPDQVRLDGPTALVIGSEGRGIKRTLREQCDHSVGIPLRHGFDSLNASVAGGVLLYEIDRQRRARKKS